MNWTTYRDMETSRYRQWPLEAHLAQRVGCHLDRYQSRKDRRKPRYAPATGRLAAAIATKRARRRPILAGAERSNELTRRIGISLSRRRNKCPQPYGAKGKMVVPTGGVETPAKIAMPAPSQAQTAVDLLLPLARSGESCSIADFPAGDAI
jgi:hypothetical protein